MKVAGVLTPPGVMRVKVKRVSSDDIAVKSRDSVDPSLASSAG